MRPLLLLCLLLSACLPAKVATPVPLELTVELLVNGNAREAITGEQLRGMEVDFPWGEGRAWRLDRFFGKGYSRPGAKLAATGTGGEVVLDVPTGSDVLVLVVNRKGEVLVGSADPSSDVFHGRGGARKRGGDSGLRVRQVSQIELRTGGGGRAEDAPKAARQGLRILGTGREPSVINLPDLAFLPTYDLRKKGKSTGKPFWSLRDLVTQELGEGATDVVLVDKRGKERPLVRWADTAWQPALRINRAGDWRFHWVDAKGVVAPDDNGIRQLREVRATVPAP